MNFFKRVRNLIELSKYESGRPQDEYKEGAQVITLIKRPEVKQNAIFIARNPVKPIDQVNNAANNV